MFLRRLSSTSSWNLLRKSGSPMRFWNLFLTKSQHIRPVKAGLIRIPTTSFSVLSSKKSPRTLFTMNWIDEFSNLLDSKTHPPPPAAGSKVLLLVIPGTKPLPSSSLGNCRLTAFILSILNSNGAAAA